MSPVLVMLKEPEASAFDFSPLTARTGVTVRRVASAAEAAPLLGETEIMVTLGPHLGHDAPAMLAGPRLRWVQLIGTGSDNVAEHLAGTDVALTSARGLHGRQMSEAAICAMLALARQMPRTLRNQADGRWDRFSSSLLAGKTVGIFGVGAIAETLAPVCQALGMRVIGISTTARGIPGFDEVRERGDLRRAVADLDHLVLLAPYSPETRHLIGARVFEAMKPSAFLINLARGGIVDERALLDALDANQLAGAALDVFESEPLPPGDRLWRHPKVIVTPHIGGLHDAYPAEVVALMTDNLERFLAGGPDALVNRVALPERLADAAE